MSDRIRTILASGDAAGLPEIARALALDTSLEPEAAEVVFAAAKKDIATATANVAQTITPPAGGQPSSTGPFHTIGVPDRVGGDTKADVKATWAKAVAHANRGFESLGA